LHSEVLRRRPTAELHYGDFTVRRKRGYMPPGGVAESIRRGHRADFAATYGEAHDREAVGKRGRAAIAVPVS